MTAGAIKPRISPSQLWEFWQVDGRRRKNVYGRARDSLIRKTGKSSSTGDLKKKQVKRLKRRRADHHAVDGLSASTARTSAVSDAKKHLEGALRVLCRFAARSMCSLSLVGANKWAIVWNGVRPLVEPWSETETWFLRIAASEMFSAWSGSGSCGQLPIPASLTHACAWYASSNIKAGNGRGYDFFLKLPGDLAWHELAL